MGVMRCTILIRRCAISKVDVRLLAWHVCTVNAYYL
jgi:hypothetical protein